MELVVGTGSTWSLRVWMCAKLSGIEINERVIDLRADNYKSEILKYSPAGLVPVLINEALVIHDSLAIVEYLNECANGRLFPKSQEKRALARSLCAEMHAGFIGVRGRCPFSLSAVDLLVEPGDALKVEIERINKVFEQATLPYMFDEVGAVDAFYAILAFRLNSYGIRFRGIAGSYQQALLDWNVLHDALQQAGAWAQMKDMSNQQ